METTTNIYIGAGVSLALLGGGIFLYKRRKKRVMIEQNAVKTFANTFDTFFPILLKHEGGYAFVKGDKGGETYMGISRRYNPSWSGWAVIDAEKKRLGVQKLKWNTKLNNLALTQSVKDYYYKNYFRKQNLHLVANKSVQMQIFDWYVNSGGNAIKNVQRVISKLTGKSLKIDGAIGKNTLKVLNTINSKQLFDSIKKTRLSYYNKIAKNGSNNKFLPAWLNRANSFNYAA